MIERHRRNFMHALNSCWVYETVPLLHTIIFLFEMAAVSLLIQKFNTQYARRPVLTTMITNAILGGVADTTAQFITAYQQRPSKQASKDDSGAIEFQDLDRKGEWPAGDLINARRNTPPPFNFERMTRFMSYGFLMAPLQLKWFGFLSSTFPITKASGTLPALKRVAFDQLIFAPFGLCCFFTFMTLAEGGGNRQLARKFSDVYVPTLKANYILWPAVQVINFRFMPLQFQIPFVSTISIGWTAYLSLTNSSSDD